MSGLIKGASSGSTQVHKSDPYKNTLPWSHLMSGLVKGASSLAQPRYIRVTHIRRTLYNGAILCHPRL